MIAYMIDDKENNPKYKSFNCATNQSHLSQRNNEVTPSWTCNTTSMCMGLTYAGWTLPKGQYERAADNLTYFCQHDQRVLDYYNEVDPTNYQKWLTDPDNNYAPNEVHAVLNYATNLWMGKTCTYWNGETSLTDICSDLRKGLPVILSAKFGTLNHIVCATGLKYLSNDTTYTNPQRLMYNDPWGLTYYYNDWNYSCDGNEIEWSKVLSDIKPVNSAVKWSHRFYKPQ